MPANHRMKLTGAAILVSRGMKVLQAAPAAYPYRSAVWFPGDRNAMDAEILAILHDKFKDYTTDELRRICDWNLSPQQCVEWFEAMRLILASRGEPGLA